VATARKEILQQENSSRIITTHSLMNCEIINLPFLAKSKRIVNNVILVKMKNLKGKFIIELILNDLLIE